MDLFLFTTAYPFGRGEAFLAKEVERAARAFDRLWVIPSAPPKGREQRELPANAELVLLHEYEALDEKKGWMPAALSAFFYEFRKSSSRFDYLIRARRRYGNLKFAWNLKERVKRFLKEHPHVPDKGVFYSYWYKEWGLALAFMKAEGMIHHSVSRAHMGDLYDSKELNMFVPFRSFKLRMSDALFPSSEHGAEYLRNEHPGQLSKVRVRHSGVEGPFEAPWTGREECFRIASCSSVTERKRVGKIMEIMRRTKSRIEWVHLGRGPLLEQMREKSQELPGNVNVRFLGALPNEEVFRFYQENPVHLFINASRNEGLPFSLMEAASFGIPMVAPAIFGIPELVNEDTGLLVPRDFDEQQVADWIDRLANDIEEQKRLRKGAKRIFEERFDGNKNLSAFAEEIKGYESPIHV
ncbi:MAG: glycosyltransferase [Flavobacteriales bacterium]